MDSMVQMSHGQLIAIILGTVGIVTALLQALSTKVQTSAKEAEYKQKLDMQKRIEINAHLEALGDLMTEFCDSNKIKQYAQTLLSLTKYLSDSDYLVVIECVKKIRNLPLSDDTDFTEYVKCTNYVINKVLGLCVDPA